MDVSELPALVGAFAFGPVCGVLVCLVKNLLHLFITTTGGVGELSNFFLGASFVLVAGLFYKRQKTRKNALLGSMAGAAVMAVCSVVINYFLTYPVYYHFMSEEMVLAMYQAIVPMSQKYFTVPDSFQHAVYVCKGAVFGRIIMFIYKHISPILKGVGGRNYGKDAIAIASFLFVQKKTDTLKIR